MAVTGLTTGTYTSRLKKMVYSAMIDKSRFYLKDVTLLTHLK
jgi:hypothetical protein